MFKIKVLEFETISDQKKKTRMSLSGQLFTNEFFCEEEDLHSFTRSVYKFNSENNLTFTKLQDPFAETIAEVLEAIIEAAPAAVATGGTVAAATLISMPPLPMTLASGVPRGMYRTRAIITRGLYRVTQKDLNDFSYMGVASKVGIICKIKVQQD